MIDRRTLLTAGVALGALIGTSKFGEAGHNDNNNERQSISTN